jgi:iron complex outermembrane receptor protein
MSTELPTNAARNLESTMRTTHLSKPSCPGRLHAGARLVTAAYGLGLLGSVLVALPTAAQAQASAAPGQTIVISTTARKKSELAQDVPIAVDIIGGQDLRDSGVTRVQDIQSSVPGLVIDTYESGGRISLRGVGTGDIGLGTDQSVAIHVDGVYQVFGSAGLGRMFDVDRVEVLRGPQGTLYGRNATAGVINLISRAPQKTFSAEADVSFGNFSTRQVQGMVNTPLGADTALRLAFISSQSDPRVTNTLDGTMVGRADEFSGARLSLTSRLGDVGLDLRAQWIKDDSDYGSSLVLNPYNPAARLGGSEEAAFSLGYYTLPPQQKKEDQSVSLKLTKAFGDVQLTSITGYGKHTGGFQTSLYNPRPTAGPKVQVSVDEPYSQWSQELQVNLNVGATEFVTGLYFIDYKGGDRRIIRLTPAASLLYDANRTGTGSSWAAFGEANHPLSKDLRLNVGLRYTTDEKSATSSSTSDTAVFGPGFVVNPPVTASKSWNAVTGRIGLDYKLSRSTMLYGSVATGYKSGGVIPSTDRNRPTAFYEPEKLTAFEVGQKTTFAGGGRLNLTAFHYDYKDKVEVYSLDQATASYYNVPKAKVTGVEGSFDMRLARYLRWDINASYTDAEFKDFPAFGGVNYAGNRPARSPRSAATTGLALEKLPLGGFGMLSGRLEVTYREKIFFSFFNRANEAERALALLNMSARLDSSDGRWTAYVAGRNLTDERYVNVTANAGVFASPAPGRSWQLGGTLRF